MTKRVVTGIIIALLAASLAVTVCLLLFVDGAEYHWGVTLAFRILWGCWIVGLFALILTRVTIFGWSFRRYFRWDEPSPPPVPTPRPTRAPWEKGSKSSFGFTVATVSVTGVAAVTFVVMWILSGMTGDFVFWLVSTIVGITWWVAVIALVLTRIAVFGAQRHKRAAELAQAAGSTTEEEE
jgi:hypothetical protein